MYIFKLFVPVVIKLFDQVIVKIDVVEVGVAVGGAGTLSTLTSFSLTGAVTSNYNSGVQEFGGLVTGVAGTGNITYTSVGTSASMYALLAVWR